jgi:hypothetical protein
MTASRSLDGARCRRVAAALAAVMLASSPGVEAKPAPASPLVTTVKRPVISAEETKRLGDGARRRAEAQESIWDRKMKAWSADICTGC